MHDATCLQCLVRAPHVAAKHTEGHLQLNSINSTEELEVEIHQHFFSGSFYSSLDSPCFVWGLTMRMQ
jgi:hypothetical protein